MPRDRDGAKIEKEIQNGGRSHIRSSGEECRNLRFRRLRFPKRNRPQRDCQRHQEPPRFQTRRCSGSPFRLFPRKSSTIRFFSFVSVLRQYMTSVRFSCMFCRISRGKSGCSPMKASYMLRLAHRKCNCSWPYHLRAYHEKNCRFIFINFVKLAN